MSEPADATLHALPPVVDARTRVLVLGSFPGAASLAAQRYYAHPRNQFWPLMAALLGDDLPALPYAARCERLLAHGLGLWDVYARCERRGSLDSAIRAAEPQDFTRLRTWAPQLAAVVHNGRESAKVRAHIEALGWPTAVLPSTSPAHAGMPFATKCARWAEALAAGGLVLRGD